MSASPRIPAAASPPQRGVARRSGSTADGGRATLAAQHSLDRALLADREHDDRYSVFGGTPKGGGGHRLEVPVDRVLVGQPLEARRLGIGLGIGTVDAVNIG